MIKKLKISILILTLGICSFVIAKDKYPTDADLKSAYCLSIEKENYEILKKLNGMSAEVNLEIDNTKNRIDRLKLFLVSRMPYIDKLPLIASMKAAEDDWAFMLKQYEICVKKYTGEHDDYAKKLLQCGDEQKDLKEKIDSCNSVNWLPY